MTRQALSLLDELQDARVHLTAVRDSGTREVTGDRTVRDLLDKALVYVNAASDRLSENWTGWDD